MKCSKRASDNPSSARTERVLVLTIQSVHSHCFDAEILVHVTTHTRPSASLACQSVLLEASIRPRGSREYFQVLEYTPDEPADDFDRIGCEHHDHVTTSHDIPLALCARFRKRMESHTKKLRVPLSECAGHSGVPSQVAA